MENKGVINHHSKIEGSNQNVGNNGVQTITNSTSNELTELTNRLVDELKKLDVYSETKQELEEVILAASEESVVENPKKGILKSFLEQSKNIIDTVNGTPSLILAYEKWSAFIKNIVNTPPVL